jgi:hypothetical protein
MSSRTKAEVPSLDWKRIDDVEGSGDDDDGDGLVAASHALTEVMPAAL